MTDPTASRFVPAPEPARTPEAAAAPGPDAAPWQAPEVNPELNPAPTLAPPAPALAHVPGLAPAPAPATGNGLATAGFVVALVGVVLSLVPIINNIAFVLAAIGLVLGIIGLVKARKGAPRKGLAVAAIVLAVVGGIGVVASQAFYGKVLDDVSDAIDDTLDDAPVATAPDTDAETDAETDAAGEPAPVEEAEPAPAEQGTRANPYPAGTTVSNADWELTLGTPREAWGEIKAANQFNDAPADGTEFWIVPLTGTFTGGDSRTPWVDLTVKFVGDDNVTYDGYCGVVPSSITDVGELYAGGTFEANACVAVPAGAPGLFTLQTGWFSDPVFFTR